jgi:hypothetical protein
MNQPRRWIDEDATQAERRLLLSARDDAPSARSRERMFAALGVGSATALGVAAAAAELPKAAALAASGAAAALSKAAPGSAGMTALVVMKWVGVGAVAGLMTSGTLNVMERRAAAVQPAAAAVAPAKPATPRAETALAVPAPEVLVPPPPELEDEPPAVEESAPEKTAARPTLSAGAVKARQLQPARAPSPNVGKEVTTLDRAREALAAGDTPRAFEALGQHESEFRSGALAPEAEVLRIEALLARGEYNSAAVMARGFLFSHPSSPHLRRVRALLARAKAAEAPAAGAD